ncbi:MAG: NAD-dependent epimerase/dehydratase family protein [Deltaproteobacteria bacterium]|nr:NAD-dependent epimerase/dehydratase family protein [Deltaproteobacteria bacterium]
MRVLVTGGAGFIGSHLCERLDADGHSVLAVDDLSTGSESNLVSLTRSPRFELVRGSVLDVDLIDPLVGRCELVIHLAAAVGVQTIMDRPVRSIETNLVGTKVVLDACAKRGTKVILASTSEVYGRSERFPFREDQDLVLGPTDKARWAYACSKALDEFLALAHAREVELPVIICRFFNTVGPRQTGRYGMVLPRFVTQALTHQPLTVYGSGLQTRCFGHVRDTIEAVVRLAATPAAIGGVFNIGTDEEVTINQLAELVKELAGSTSPIQRLAYSDVFVEGFEDMDRRVPDCSKLEATIGFRPRAPLREIVQDVIDHTRSTL